MSIAVPETLTDTTGSAAVAPPVRKPNTGRKFVCRCLRVTEQDVREAMEAHVVCDLVDLMQHTGAGTGCMACRANIRKIISGCDCPDKRSCECGCDG